MTDKVEVTQAELDAAWTALFGENIIRTPQRKLLVLACARHRIEATRTAEAENERLRKRVRELEAATIPDEAGWNGLARDIMRWLDMHGPGEKTPRNLFKHLKRIGRDVPKWLRDEPEMKHLDHVPSKGTRCVIIFKAMMEDMRAEALGSDNHG